MTKEKLQELQLIENNLQNIFLQKQAFQMELSEIQEALKEISSSGEEVFKIIGQLMLKSDKEKIKEELRGKEKILDLRIKTLEKQEDSFTKRIEILREELTKSMKK